MMITPALGLRLAAPALAAPRHTATTVSAATELLRAHGLEVQLRGVDLTVQPGLDRSGDEGEFSLRVTQVDPAGQEMLVHAEVGLAVDKTVVEEGTLTFLAPVSHVADLDERLRVASPEWGRLVAAQLESMPDFATAAAHYDGTIGWAAPGRQVHFRIYRGRVVDVSRRAVKGADFTVTASGGTWLDLVTAPTNEFMDRAMEGEFTTDGDGYEYLRTTKLLVLITEAARVIAGEVR